MRYTVRIERLAHAFGNRTASSHPRTRMNNHTGPEYEGSSLKVPAFKDNEYENEGSSLKVPAFKDNEYENEGSSLKMLAFKDDRHKNEGLSLKRSVFKDECSCENGNQSFQPSLIHENAMSVDRGINQCPIITPSHHHIITSSHHTITSSSHHTITS